jgi:hypothetical protein
MSLKARLGRLEVVAGKGHRNCPLCRVNTRPNPPGRVGRELQPDEQLNVRCEMCGDEYKVSLAKVAEDERDVHRLSHSFTTEDAFTNPKAHALQLWLTLRRDVRRKLKPQKPPVYGRHPVAKKKEPPRSAAVFDEAVRFYRRRLKELEAKYGADRFPEHAELIKTARAGHVRRERPGVYVDIWKQEEIEADYLTMLALEKVIWGEERASTVAELAAVRAEIDEKVVAAVAAAEEREQKRREANERYRRERDEREAQMARERAEREGQTPPVQAHDFWSTPPSEPPVHDPIPPEVLRQFRESEEALRNLNHTSSTAHTQEATTGWPRYRPVEPEPSRMARPLHSRFVRRQGKY